MDVYLCDVRSVLVLLFLFCDVVVGILSRAVLTSASGSSDGTLSVTRGILWGRLVVAWGV